MPRTKQWLHFFEQPSERRDVESWYRPIEEKIQAFGLTIRHLVSDRASALVQLGKQEYLGVCSMPDLFHFNQSLGHKAGAFIGKAWCKTLKAYLEIKQSGAYYSKRQPLEYRHLWQEAARLSYQKGIHLIHKAIHGIDEEGQWKEAAVIKKSIRLGIRQIDAALIKSKALKSYGKENIEDLYNVEKDLQDEGLDTDLLLKLDKQIPAILEGVKQWQDWVKGQIKNYVASCIEMNIFPQQTIQGIKSYLLKIVLPLIYFQVILNRTPAKKRNKNLRSYYQKLIARHQKKWKAHPLTRELTEEQLIICQQWANYSARHFQRSSSQVEGRNGYLAFIHKANRGMPKQRLQTLTVIHNFDVRGLDGRTPAERLFQKSFPSIFDFVLQSVTSFPEPRHHKHQPLKTLAVHA